MAIARRCASKVSSMKVCAKDRPARKRIDRFDQPRTVAIDFDLFPTLFSIHPLFSKPSASVQTYRRYSIARHSTLSEPDCASARSHSVSSTRITSGFLFIRSATLIVFLLSSFRPFFLSFFLPFFFLSFFSSLLFFSPPSLPPSLPSFFSYSLLPLDRITLLEWFVGSWDYEKTMIL